MSPAQAQQAMPWNHVVLMQKKYSLKNINVFLYQTLCSFNKNKSYQKLKKKKHKQPYENFPFENAI